MKKKYDIYFLLKLFAIIAIITIIVFKFNTLNHNSESHKLAREYFKEKENKSIQLWMTPQIITKEFGIKPDELEVYLGIKMNRERSTSTLETICRKEDLNCEELIATLNENSQFIEKGPNKNNQNRGPNSRWIYMI